MKSLIRQRSPGTWQISYKLGRDSLDKRGLVNGSLPTCLFNSQRNVRSLV